jgi:hypothetical protein
MASPQLPLETIWREIASFLMARADVVLFGSHAVNLYAKPERATHDVDLMSTNAARLAEDLRGFLTSRFHIAIRVRER